MIELAMILLGAGTGGLISAAFQAWRTTRTTPAEVGSMIADGAEKAVRSLAASLAAETARADRAEEQVRQRDAQIDLLEQRIEGLQSALNIVRDEVRSLRSTNPEH